MKREYWHDNGNYLESYFRGKLKYFGGMEGSRKVAMVAINVITPVARDQYAFQVSKS
jgi:hypothetical protein